MKLFIDSMFLSADSTNAEIADDETPCASGALRGKSPATANELPKAATATTKSAFMLGTLWGGGGESWRNDLTEDPIISDRAVVRNRLAAVA
jgi:hypothetical protein